MAFKMDTTYSHNFEAGLSVNAYWEFSIVKALLLIKQLDK